MKPIELELSAFGAFRDKLVLDFTKLGQQHLFLIAGPTGAGKTTLLDAMSYALYGKTSGGIRDGAQMRSDYADSSQVSYVRFTFAMGQERYQMYRAPKQDINRKRGQGVRTVEARAELFKWDAETNTWQSLSTRAKEIAEAVEGIIGFRADQFLQVILLPQGDFRKLLVASSNEREQLLQTLFKTELFKRLQDLLQEEYDKKGSLIADLQRQEQILLDQWACASKQELLDKQEVLVNAIEEEEKALGLAEVEAEAFAEGWRLSKQRKEWERALLEQIEGQKSWQAKAEDMQTKESYLAREGAFTEGLLIYTQWQDALTSRNRLSKEVGEAESQLLGIQDRCRQCKEKKDQWAQGEADRQILNKQCQTLQFMEESMKKVPGIDRQIETSKDDLAKASVTEEEEKLISSLQAVAKVISSISVFSEDTYQLADKLVVQYKKAPWYSQVFGDLTAWLQKRQTILVDKRNLEGKQIAALAQKEQCERIYQAVTASYEQGEAYRLASHLQDNEACPVCGSRQHPSLAIPPERLCNKADVEEAKKEQDRVLQLVASLEEQVEANKNRMDQCKEALLAAWQRAGKTAALIGVSKQADRQVKLERQQKAQEDIKRLQEERDSLYKQAGVTSYEDYKKLYSQVTKQVELFKREEESIEAAYEQVKDEVIKGEAQVVSKRQQEKEAIQAEQVVYEKWQALSQKENMTEADLMTWQTQQDYLPQWKEDVADYYKKEQELTLRIQDLQKRLEGVKDHTEVSEEEKDQAQKKRQECLEIVTRSKQEKEQCQEALQKISSLRQKKNHMDKENAFIYSLSDVANGGASGIKGVTFERYVLGTLLEEVTLAANQRLLQMSRGRYELRREGLDGKGRGSRGLDLSVFDSYTGYERSAKTLSGGETFLASLALALGLADCIQAYAGGLHLDTIFIDEGFGTLDPETLDIAMQTLVDLQESGRLVGIISHVPELKQRISARLEVTSGDRGSQAHFVV